MGVTRKRFIACSFPKCVTIVYELEPYLFQQSKKWTYEQLKGSAVILNPQTGTNKYASQKGMTGFGMPRSNIAKSKDLGYIAPDKRGDDFLRLQCGTNIHASQKGDKSYFAPLN